jgi:hypothetical protein
VTSDLILYAYTTTAANYALSSATDAVVVVDATGAQRFITLPVSNGSNLGRCFAVKKVDASSNLVTVQSQSGQLIDGNGTAFNLSTQNDAFFFLSNGTGWWIL